MALAEWYLPLKHTHVALVLLSGSLFAIRGLAALGGARWPLAPAVHRSSVAIDTALLGAALLLLAILGLNPLLVPWLRAKLLLLVAYIVLGSLALRRARRPVVRRLCYGAALASFLAMYWVATHRPF